MTISGGAAKRNKRLVEIIGRHLDEWQEQIDSDIRADYERERQLMAKQSLAAVLTTLANGSTDERVKVAQTFPMITLSSHGDILAALNSVPAADVEQALRGSNGRVSAAVVEEAEEIAEQPRKRRGRPPGTGKKAAPVKAKPAPVADDDDSDEEEETPAPKRRGRPPGSGKKSKGKPGRPPKARAVEVDDDEEEEEAPAPKRRGRPPGKAKAAPAPKGKAKKSKVVEDDDDDADDEIEALMTDEDEEEDYDESDDDSDDEDDDDD